MEVGSPEWIEASLARLDELEQERTEHETALETVDDPAALRQHNQAIEQLSAEIKTLYAQLEAIAEDEDEDEDENEDEDEGDDSPIATQGDDELSAPHVSTVEAGDGAGAGDGDGAAAGEETAAATAAVAAPISTPADSPLSSSIGGDAFAVAAPVAANFDDDFKPKGGAGKWVFLLVVVLAGGGVGGYFAWANMQAQKADTKGPAEPEIVIKAAEVPDDTEAPNAAPGSKATISPNANVGDDSASKKKKKKEEKEDKPLVLKGGDGPL